MTIFDHFINGLGYGACAVGFALMFVSVTMILLGFIGAILHYFGEDGDDE